MTSLRSSVDIPEGITFRGLDRQTDVPSPYGILRTIFRGRALTPEEHKFSPFESPGWDDGKALVFVASCEFTVSRDMYLPFNISPVSMTTELLSYRKSSYVVTSKLYTSAKHVASLDTNLVYVDKITRKPLPLPDWWTEKFKGLHKKSPGPSFRGFNRQTETVCKGMKTRPFIRTVPRRDQDGYNHTNTSSYFQYCIDAIENHLHTNNIECDIYTVSMLLKRAQYLHLGESRAGDMLSVAFWDDKNEPNTVCFDISKSGQSVYQAKMEFYGKHVLEKPKSKM